MQRFALIALLFILAGLGRSGAAPAKKTPGKEDQRKLAGQVYQIFEAKCVDCHGSHLPKPNGGSQDDPPDAVASIDPQDYEVVSDLDDLLASEDDNVWSENESLLL